MAQNSPPKHLAPATAEWFSRVVADFELDAHHLRLLTSACDMWDRAETAAAVVRALGLVFSDRFGQPRERPEVAIERNSRLAFAKLLRELNLDVEPPQESRLPRGARYGR